MNNMNYTTPILAVSLFFSLFLFVLLTYTNAYALPNEHQIPSLQTSSTLAKLYPIITSLSKGQQVSIGKDIVLSGLITAYDAASRWQVSIDANGANPHQSTIDTGHNEAAKQQQEQDVIKTNNSTAANKTNADTTLSIKSVTMDSNKAVKNNNSTRSTALTSRTLDLIYVDNSKLSGYVGNTKSTAQDAPFILPFP
jgi:hypothetical protein